MLGRRSAIIAPMARAAALGLIATAVLACGSGRQQPRIVEEREGPSTITIVATADLHGRLHALPMLAGYLRVLRQKRANDGAVVLLDAGDLFQGTLESNLLEGAPVIEAYNALGYDAVAIGNHEFDYGPIGERVTPATNEDDPRGALLARARQASFPLLNANLKRVQDGERIEWDNVPPSVLIERGGVRIGIVGVTTEDTLRMTISANVRDLAIEPVADAVSREARNLRERGAELVIVAAHAGGACRSFEDPHNLSECRPEDEIFRVAQALEAGSVDAIVAGHTHQAVAHVVNGIPVVQAYSYGRAFSRIDLRVHRGRVLDFVIHPPRDLCEQGSTDAGDCDPGMYEGERVEPVDRIARVIEPALTNAREIRERPVGVRVTAPIARSYSHESPLGNLFTDLMLAARSNAHVAVTNGGGLRADLPTSELTYGEFYEAMPFDNRFALMEISVADLSRIVAENLGRGGSFLSIGGVRAEARCESGRLDVRIVGLDGRALPPAQRMTLVTTDFLATGGDGVLAHVARASLRVEEDGDTVRDAMVAVLSARGGTLSPESVFDRANPRVRYPGERPVRCPQ